MTIICEKHGEVEEHTLGVYNFCPTCIAETVLFPRINHYNLEE